MKVILLTRLCVCGCMSVVCAHLFVHMCADCIVSSLPILSNLVVVVVGCRKNRAYFLGNIYCGTGSNSLFVSAALRLLAINNGEKSQTWSETSCI